MVLPTIPAEELEADFFHAFPMPEFPRACQEGPTVTMRAVFEAAQPTGTVRDASLKSCWLCRWSFLIQAMPKSLLSLFLFGPPIC
jgi:hypothetical protein